MSERLSDEQIAKLIARAERDHAEAWRDVGFTEAPPSRMVQALRELQRLRASADGGTPSSAWQPIETAPKDGTEVLVYRPKMRGRDRIQIRVVRDWCGPTCCPSAEPTHWQPLPAAPSGETQEAQE